MTLSRTQVAHLLADNGLRPRRALGQHFVADPNTVRRVARLARLEAGQPVVEVGVGQGEGERTQAGTGARVTALEVDDRVLPVLRSLVEPRGVRVVEADAMSVDWEELLRQEEGGPGCPNCPDWSLVANLPYNVAVPVVMRVLDEAPAIGRMLVMVQREVGERLAAEPGDKAYGLPSVRIAYHGAASVVGKVPASVFVPRPRVESVLVRIERRPTPAVDPGEVPVERLFTVVRAGFAQRRKTLRRALAGVVRAEAFDEAGVSPRARAEELSIVEWGRLVACDLGPRPR